MERWLSGLRRTIGNRVWAYTPPRVQIPLSPPKFRESFEKTARVFVCRGPDVYLGKHWCCLVFCLSTPLDFSPEFPARHSRPAIFSLSQKPSDYPDGEQIKRFQGKVRTKLRMAFLRQLGNFGTIPVITGKFERARLLILRFHFEEKPVFQRIIGTEPVR